MANLRQRMKNLLLILQDLSSTIDAKWRTDFYLNDSLVNTYSVLSDAIVSQQEELTTTKDELLQVLLVCKEKDAYLEDSLVNTYSVLSDAISSQQEELTTKQEELTNYDR